MIYARRPPDGTPLERLLRVELHVARRKATEIDYSAVVLIEREGRAMRVAIPVPFDPAWELAPRAVREELIRQGGRELARILYSVPSHDQASVDYPEEF
jgi:hypothetical protein